jgi:hypothetical protein
VQGRCVTWVGCCLCATTSLAIDITNAGGKPVLTAVSLAPQARQEVPHWLLGVWTRNWIEEDGRKSNTLDVHYLQTPTFFGDVRIPIDRPKFQHATSFADLSDQELQLLARQLGFAGLATAIGTRVTWLHQVDFQPPEYQEDAARIEMIAPGQMSEHGLDGGYTESWSSTTDGSGRFLVIRTESDARTRRSLLVAGNYFLYVRNRAKDLPRATSLAALIRAPGTTRAQVIEYLDCEFSFGRIHSERVAWQIERSTLPWREGRRLDFVDQLELEVGELRLRLRSTASERLVTPTNTLTRSELMALFGNSRTAGSGGRFDRTTQQHR